MGKIFDDLITVGIIGFIVLWFASKLRKETITETLNWIKDLLKPGEDNEQG